ncbi:YggT family protein [Paroceanicella profunda]|uniref:YggT family protein n=1 Tax=Paroceanicella profunda TaxID=2579971 RepID=A0A5B8FGQ8_9RHOB|nr:YggT family protein [Paroceanicella profunda]QDL91531.1 YggT family protein [Paroceanicella profunda]
MTTVVVLVYHMLSALWLLILVHLVMGLLLRVRVLNYERPSVRGAWNGLSGMLDPLYRPLRRVLPGHGRVDLAPVATLFFVLGVQAMFLLAGAARLL